MSIQERQNLPESLEKLAAQGLLYRRAKRIRNVRMLLVALIAIAALAGFYCQNNHFTSGVMIAVIFTWFLDQIVLKELERKIKREAATIHEEFDCEVLDLPWPDYKRVKRPTRDRIRQLARLARRKPKNIKNLKDWYTPDRIPNEKTQAQVFCQKMNCWWDLNLRKRWRTVLSVSLWAFAGFSILLAVVTEITVAMFVGLVASGLRILAWGIAELKGQGEAIKTVQGLHELLSKSSDNPSMSSSYVRSIQDEIFEHRIKNPPVPGWFFWLNRNRQEAEAANS